MGSSECLYDVLNNYSHNFLCRISVHIRFDDRQVIKMRENRAVFTYFSPIFCMILALFSLIFTAGGHLSAHSAWKESVRACPWKNDLYFKFCRLARLSALWAKKPIYMGFGFFIQSLQSIVMRYDGIFEIIHSVFMWNVSSAHLIKYSACRNMCQYRLRDLDKDSVTTFEFLKIEWLFYGLSSLMIFVFSWFLR